MIAVIIPCYNDGKYLLDAIDSIEQSSQSDLYELIIVNDGSSDSNTLQVLKTLREKGICILDQPNQGLAKARNAGIAAAKSEFVLPLDADNKLRPLVMTMAYEYLLEHEDCDAVYTNRELFGEATGIVSPGEPSLVRLLYTNDIDACALYRKSLFQRIGGFDDNMPATGNEDWELWVRMKVTGAKTYFLNEVGFDYRVRSDSMFNTVTKHQEDDNRCYILLKYEKQAAAAYVELYRIHERLNQQILFEQHRRDTFKQHLKKNRILSAIKVAFGKDFSF